MTTNWAVLLRLEAATQGSDYSPLFSTSETASGVLCPVLAGHGHTGASPTKGYEDGWGGQADGATLVRRRQEVLSCPVSGFMEEKARTVKGQEAKDTS